MWSVLGAIAASTERLHVGVGVTCPIIRIHPAIIAQATATTSLLFEGRFFFGVGTGEAVEVVRELWSGETVDHRGDFYEVENAKLFDPPVEPPSVIVSGFGPKATELAARIGDGYWGHSPEHESVDRYRANGGAGPCYAQLNVCWADAKA